MILIPKQLQKENIRFIKIRPNTKFPFEEDWVKTNNYDYKNENLLRYLQADGNYGIVTGNEEIQDDAKPIKYLMKSFPISSQAAGLLPMFYPDLSKDLGIRMQGQYGIR